MMGAKRCLAASLLALGGLGEAFIPLPSAHQASPSRIPLSAAVSTTVPSSAGDALLSLEAYDGAVIDAYYNRNPWPIMKRMSKLAPPVFAWWAGVKLDNATVWAISPDEKGRRENRRAIQLREALVSSGSVTFIKAGQAIAQRGDLLKSAAYARELEKLQDAVGTFDTKLALNIIREELGVGSPHDLFEFEFPEPVASASIGQVYKARLRSNNRTVALKVQRPDAFDSVTLDMYILRRLAELYKRMRKLKSDMVGIADVFGVQLFGELDYRQEARNAIRFRELHGQLEGIYVPDVYTNLTARRVLVMEWVDGEKGPWVQDGRRMLALGLRCSVIQLFSSGYFHADPHRGNLLRTPDSQLCYLDFGSMAEVSAKKRYALLGTVFALQNRDLGLLTESLVELGFLPDTTDLDVVVPALENAFRNASGGSAVVSSKVNITQLSRNIQEISYILPLQIPPFFSLITRTLTILEGLALNVDPDFRIVKGAFPYIADFVLGSGSPNSKDGAALRELMKRVLLTKEGRIDWKRLEQFIAVSQAVKSSDFDQYKKATEMSDIRKVLLGEQEEDDKALTLDLALRIVEFLLSENGLFLKNALVNEVVDTVDAVQLASFGLVPVISGGLLPRPPVEQPDRERLEGVIKLLSDVVAKREEDANLNTTPPQARPVQARGAAGGRIPYFLNRINELLEDTEFRAQIAPLLRAGLPLVNERSSTRGDPIISPMALQWVAEVSEDVPVAARMD